MIVSNYCHLIILLKSLTSSSGNQASINNTLFNVLIQSTASQLAHSTVLRWLFTVHYLGASKHSLSISQQLYTRLTQHGIAKYQNTNCSTN